MHPCTVLLYGDAEHHDHTRELRRLELDRDRAVMLGVPDCRHRKDRRDMSDTQDTQERETQGHAGEREKERQRQT